MAKSIVYNITVTTGRGKSRKHKEYIVETPTFLSAVQKFSKKYPTARVESLWVSYGAPPVVIK